MVGIWAILSTTNLAVEYHTAEYPKFHHYHHPVVRGLQLPALVIAVTGNNLDWVWHREWNPGLVCCVLAQQEIPSMVLEQENHQVCG